MLNFLTTGNDKYLEFYKNDDFIEGENIQENFFERYKEEFLGILNIYYNLQNDFGSVDIDYNSNNENSLFKKIDNIGDELKKEISDNKILFRQENGILFISINNYLISRVEKNIIEKYNIDPKNNIAYRGEHSYGFERYLSELNGFNNNEKEELSDYFDSHKKLVFSNIDDLEKVIEFYDKIRLEYLYEKFSFDYNKFDEKFYKVLSNSSIGGYPKLLTFFKEEGIIKNFSYQWSLVNTEKIDGSSNYPSKSYRVGTIELENITIDILTCRKDNNIILFLSTNILDGEIIEFLEKAYFSQKNIILNESKQKVASLLGVGAEINVNKKELHSFTDKLTVSNFGTTDIEEEIQKYNIHIRGIIDTRKDKIFSKTIIKKDIDIYKENINQISSDDKKINKYLIYGKYDDGILKFIVNNDLKILGNSKEIYWDKYLYGSKEKIIENYFKNTTLPLDEIEQIALEYVKFYVEKNNLESNFTVIYSRFNNMIIDIFGVKNDSILLNHDIEKFIELELKKAYIEEIDFNLDRGLWQTKQIEEIVEFTNFCKFFNLDISKYIGNHTIFKMYENTLKIRNLTNDEIIFLKGKGIVLNNIYNSFIHTDNYKYIDNLTGLLSSEMHKTMNIDLGQALRESDVETTTRILYLSKKFGIYKTLMWKQYFFGVKENIDVLNFLKNNFKEVYDEFILESKKEEHVKINKNLELVTEKINFLTNIGYSHILIRLDKEKINFLSDFLAGLNYEQPNKTLNKLKISPLDKEKKEEVLSVARKILGESMDKGLDFLLNDLLLDSFIDFNELKKEYSPMFQKLLDGEICDNLNKEFFPTNTLDVIGPKLRKILIHRRGGGR